MEGRGRCAPLVAAAGLCPMAVKGPCSFLGRPPWKEEYVVLTPLAFPTAPQSFLSRLIAIQRWDWWDDTSPNLGSARFLRFSVCPLHSSGFDAWLVYWLRVVYWMLTRWRGHGRVASRWGGSLKTSEVFFCTQRGKAGAGDHVFSWSAFVTFGTPGELIRFENIKRVFFLSH